MTTFQQVASSRTNLITNPSFEVDATGWNSLHGSVFLTYTQHVFGSASGNLQSDGGGVDGLYFYTGETGLKPTPGQTYTFSIFVAQDAANPISKDFQARIEWYNNGSFISFISGAIVTPSVVTSGWTRFSVSGVAPVGATRATPAIYSTSATASGDSFFFDGALFEQSTTVNDYFDGSIAGFTQANLANNPSFDTTSGTVTVRTNIILNPNFEGPSLAYWSSNQAGTILSSTTEKYIGSASAQVTVTSAAGYDGIQSNGYTVTSGQTYSASAWVKAPVGFNFEFILGDGASLTEVFYVGTGDWQRVTATKTVATTALTIYVTKNLSALVAGVFYVDAVCLETGTIAGDYFDGSTTASGDFTYAWSGTANASASYQNAKGLANWSVATITNGVIYQSTQQTYLGSASAIVKQGNNYTFARLNGGTITTPPGTYTLSAWVYSSASKIDIVFRDNGGYAFYQKLITPNTWTRITQTVAQSGSNAIWDIGWEQSEATEGTIAYLDAVVLERGLVTHDFYTGNYSPLTQTANAWTATANASTSVQTVYVYTTQTTPTTYRYLFADLVTNQILAELPLTNVSFTTVLNGAGAFSGTMLVTDATQTYLNIWGATQPARTAVYVERFSSGGSPTLVWGGIVWARDYNSTSQHVTFNASEFESYFDKRKIIAVSGATGSQVYKNTDPVVIARTLIQNAETFTIGGSVLPQSNIGVNVGSETSSATVSKTYYDAELKSVLSAIQDLSHASTSGFDFKIVVAYDSSFNPTKTFKIGYPRLGTVYSATNPTAPVMEFPGNVIEYTLLEDGTLASNFIYAVGVGNGQGKLNRYSYDAGQWSSGWPFLEAATNYGDVSNQTLLDNLALGQLNAVKNPPISLKIVYPPYQDPVLGSYSLGDDVRVRINDDRAGQVDDYYRIVSISVTPGENNAGERATLTLTQKGAV